MPYEFFQIPVSGQGGGKDELNRLLRGGRIASVRKEFVVAGENSFWAFCLEVLDGQGADSTARHSVKAEPVDYKQIWKGAQPDDHRAA